MKNKLFSVMAIFGFITISVAQSITGFTNVWNNTYSASNGIFARAILDNGSLVVSGSNWPLWPSGTTDQMITKISSTGGKVFQTVRAPGWDHDSFRSVCILDNGNYAFFGQENAEGTQYFDAFFTVFNTAGVEVSHDFFAIPGSSSGDDMKKLPNGNLIYTGNNGGGLNFIALTDQTFHQINYQTFPVGPWNLAQLAVDTANSLIYAIGSEPSSSVVQIKKYDYALNLLGSYSLSNTGPILNNDAIILNNQLLLCGYKEISGTRYGTISKLDLNGNILDSYTSTTASEFTAIVTSANDVIVSKSNLSPSNYSTSNEIQVYLGNGIIGKTFLLNGGLSFVTSDLIVDQNSLYIIGAQETGYYIGKPAVQKVTIQACNIIATQPTNQNTNLSNNGQFNVTSSDLAATYQWQTDVGLGFGFQNLSNIGQYSGVTSNQLSVLNTTLNNNNQLFRCVLTSDQCNANSNVISLTVNDLGNSCTTLLIDTGVLSYNPTTFANTITIYPNPANDNITIDCGTIANIKGWSINITNVLGQEVFNKPMNTQQYVVPLNTWTGHGIYFVKIYDALNNLMNTKKIILQ
jgi:hypothetical protein